jgi:hypothetical protein
MPVKCGPTTGQALPHSGAMLRCRRDGDARGARRQESTGAMTGQKVVKKRDGWSKSGQKAQ